MERKLKVQFPIQGLGAWEKGIQNLGQHGNTEDHAIGTPCWMIGSSWRKPEATNICRLPIWTYWSVWCKSSRCRKGQEIPAGNLCWKGGQGVPQAFEKVVMKENIALKDRDHLVSCLDGLVGGSGPVPDQG